MFEIIIAIVVSFSFGVVAGRLTRNPIGRWAFIVVMLAAIIGVAYLYGMVGGVQTGAKLNVFQFPKLW